MAIILRGASRCLRGFGGFGFSRVVAGGLLIGFLMVSGTAFGQRGTINVGISTAKPGDTIDIPLTLSGTEQPKLGSITAEIALPKNALSFTKADAGLAGEAAEAVVQGKVQEGGNADLSVVRLTISAKRPIKPGILAYMKLQVSKETKKGSLKLKLDSVKAGTAEGQPLELAKGKDGEVMVFNLDEQIPQIGCFFFTH